MMIEWFWILLIFPLAGTILCGLLGHRLSERQIGLIGSGAVFLSFLVSLWAFFHLIGLPEEQRVVTVQLFTWIQAGGFTAPGSFLLDPLSAVMILVVTGVGFLIHVYSVEYMRGEEGYYRYFAYLNLFIFMMGLLVLAGNYLVMFVGWEGVGLCSFLLIGYYFESHTAGNAAKKAFVVNRIGDVGFILGVFLIFRTFGSVEYLEVFESAAARFPEPQGGFGVLFAITVLLFIGATGKSAQIPLYVWLPDAMAGPTPVSALIHAATMVTAGVYMIARSAALYSRAPETLMIVATVGILTALLAALIALGQRDIKKVLAYSTVSQLGYMFLGVGVGAFAAGIFHLYTHAFFKALLFLGSGSVILALHHEQDMFKMGGLKKYLPITWATMGIATLAIAGIPPLAGFFSKDEILWEALSSDHGAFLYWLIGFIVAGLTAFYMARLMFLTFYGEERFSGTSDHSEDNGGETHESHQHRPPREPSRLVTIPLMILAFLSLAGGLVGLPAWLGGSSFGHFLEPAFYYAYSGEEHAQHAYLLEIGLAALVVALAVAAIWYAHQIFVKDPDRSTELSKRFIGTYTLIKNKFFVDEIYNALIINPLVSISRGFLWRGVDEKIVDGAVNGTAALMRRWSQAVKKMQTGYVRSYAGWILFGTVLICVYYYVQS